MPIEILQGLAIPFLGTTLGAACVFLLRGELDHRIQKAFTGFAAGIMVAASVWSLLIPSMEESSALGSYAVLPAVVGFWVGTLFLLLLDHIIPHLHLNSDEEEGPKSALSKNLKLVLAVTLHNIPEGMAVGAAYAGCVAAGAAAPAAAFTLALAIAIQNVPEGAIVALPLRTAGAGKGRAFLGGVLSGAVEPLAAGVTVLAAALIVPALPWLLGFAAGAMLYVVAAELLPTRGDSGPGALAFAAGFTVMMILDVALG